MKVITDEARAGIAAGWLNSPMTQAEYARQHDISPRTLRLYLQRHAGRHGERQAPAQDVDVRLQKVLDDVDLLDQRIDKLQAEVDALHATLAASALDVTGQREPEVSVKTERHADAAGPAGTEHRHDAPSEPEPRPVVDARAADRSQQGSALTNSTDHTPAGGMHDGVRSSSTGQEPQRRRRRTFAEMILEDPDTDEGGPVGGNGVDNKHPAEPERHASSAEHVQATTPAPEPEVEPLLPVSMPSPGACWWG